MQVYETVACHIDTRDINIENCKQIVPIILSGFDWWQPCPRQGPVQRIATRAFHANWMTVVKEIIYCKLVVII